MALTFEQLSAKARQFALENASELEVRFFEPSDLTERIRDAAEYDYGLRFEGGDDRAPYWSLHDQGRGVWFSGDLDLDFFCNIRGQYGRWLADAQERLPSLAERERLVRELRWLELFALYANPVSISAGGTGYRGNEITVELGGSIVYAEHAPSYVLNWWLVRYRDRVRRRKGTTEQGLRATCRAALKQDAKTRLWQLLDPLPFRVYFDFLDEQGEDTKFLRALVEGGDPDVWRKPFNDRAVAFEDAIQEYLRDAAVGLVDLAEAEYEYLTSDPVRLADLLSDADARFDADGNRVD